MRPVRVEPCDSGWQASGVTFGSARFLPDASQDRYPAVADRHPLPMVALSSLRFAQLCAVLLLLSAATGGIVRRRFSGAACFPRLRLSLDDTAIAAADNRSLRACCPFSTRRH